MTFGQKGAFWANTLGPGRVRSLEALGFVESVTLSEITAGEDYKVYRS